MSTYTILDSKWYSPGQGTGMQIGVVAVRSTRHAPDEWEAFIGFGHSLPKEVDEMEVAEYGCGLTQREAAGFFPQFDSEKYRRI